MTSGRPRRRGRRGPASSVLAGFVVCALVGCSGTGRASETGDPAGASAPGAPGTSAANAESTVGQPSGDTAWRTKPIEPAMDPRMTKRFARAQRDAAAAGISLQIHHSIRSATWQQELFNNAVIKYGSAAEARKWVLPPEESFHVKGRAIDVQPRSAGTWLEERQEKYGVCRTFENEWWHFELNVSGKKCPAMLPNAAARQP